MNTVLVTGANGFLGRHVALRFAQAGWRVHGLGRSAWAAAEAREWGVERWSTQGVCRAGLEAAAADAAAIVHCAGGASVQASYADPLADFDNSVATTAAVLDHARRSGAGCRVVLASSAAVYGRAQRVPIAEDDAAAPVSPYGVHKLMAEQLCRSYAAHHQVPVAIVRYFSIYGPGLRKQLLWDTLCKAARGEYRFAGTGHELRDWLHVSDAAALAEVATAHAGSGCATANGGAGTGVAVGEVVAGLHRRFGAARAPEFTGTARAGDPEHYVADIATATAWGWRPRIGLDAGLDEYTSWFGTATR